MKYPVLLLLASACALSSQAQFAIRPTIGAGYLASVYTPRKTSGLNGERWKERTDPGAYFTAGAYFEKKGLYLPVNVTYALNNTYRERTAPNQRSTFEERRQQSLNISAGVGINAETEYLTIQSSLSPGFTVFTDRESNTSGYQAFPTLTYEALAYRKYLGLRFFAAAPLGRAVNVDQKRHLWNIGLGVSYRFMPRRYFR